MKKPNDHAEPTQVERKKKKIDTLSISGYIYTDMYIEFYGYR